VKLSRDDFAAKCKVSKMAISKAVRRGALIEDDQGRINTADPVNRAYLQADHAVMKRAKAKGKAARGRGARSEAAADIMAEKTIQQTRQYKSNADWAIQRRAKDLELLVERAEVERRFAVFGSELKIRLLDLPRRLSVHLYSLARSEGSTPMAIEGLLGKELSDAIAACKEKARALKLGSLGS
jgi:hypothetical protein